MNGYIRNIFAALIAFTLVLFSAMAPAADPKQGGTLRMAVAGAPNHFDPATFAGTAGYVIRRAYNFLVRIGDDLVPQPDLAKSWSSPDNGQTWKFELNQGVKFHHGTEFTAKDVIYTYERLLDPDVGSAGAAVLGGIDTMEANGQFSLTIGLKAKDADFPLKLGTYQMPILAHDFPAENLKSKVSGTGPYRMTEFVPGEKVVMERNEQYWEDGLPYIDRVEIITIAEAATQVNALLSGQIDLLPQLPVTFVSQLKTDDRVAVGYPLAGAMHTIYMRSDQPPFNDNRVRRAVKLTLDRNALLQAVRLGVGEVSNDNPLPSGNPWFTDTGVMERDIDEAKRLLEEAGYADGLKEDLFVPGGNDGLLELAVGIQGMARPAGFQFNIVVIPSDVFWGQNWLKENFGVDSWSMRGTADEQIRIAYYCGAAWNESHTCLPEMDAALDKAAASTDPAERKAHYATVQQIFSDEGGSAIPYHFSKVGAYTTALKGYKVHPMGLWDDPRVIWLDR